MKITVVNSSITEYNTDVIIVNLFKGVTIPGGGTGAVDKALDGEISKRIIELDFEGKLGDILVIETANKLPARYVILIGLGESAKFGIPEILKVSAIAVRKAEKLKAKTVSTITHGAGIAGIDTYSCARAVALGTMLGIYSFNKYKTKDIKPSCLEDFNIVESDSLKIQAIENGVSRAKLIAESVYMARDLGNEPSNVVTPEYLAEIASDLADEYSFDLTILDRKQIKDKKMGLLSAVSRGASVEPRFINMKYSHPEAKETIAIIGKGITFDTGGHSLKLAASMFGMKDDMSGAAAVLGIMKAVGESKPKVNIIMLIPATENAIGSKSIHPGDIFKSLDGKTVEINNTDAEGRLVLADAITYAKNLKVDKIIDLATLTGACIVAVGKKLNALLSNDDEIAAKLTEYGKICGDKLCRLPLESDYKKMLESNVADLKNTPGPEAGTITAALFLESFVGDTPWAHIDMASVVTDEDLPLARKGNTAPCVGMMIEYLLNL